LDCRLTKKQMCLESKYVSSTYTVKVSDLGISGGMLSCYHEGNANEMLTQYLMGFLLALHCFALQGIVVYYIYQFVAAKMGEHDVKDAPWVLVVVAIYLHLHNIVSAIPAGGSAVVKAFNDGAWLALSVIFVDSVIMPVVTIILGALFLCTSGSINDLLLNSCAVAFVTYIDDWIVKGLYAWTQNLGEEEDVDLPSHGKTSIRVVMWSAFFVPVIPVMICVGLAHLGLNVLDL